MNEQEFKEKFESEKPIFQAWGTYVSDMIIEKLSMTENINEFLKVRSEPRVKDTTSIIAKAFYRKKPYINPYEEITDKVGVRFVVLLVEDIKKIGKVVEDFNDIWDFSQDRDFEKEREERPTIFEYQSNHYVVKNKNTLSYNDVEIPSGTPCEIQIRTLLQHAYSELTHDTVYKPNTLVIPMVHRIIARSMALIETTDNLFGEVSEVLATVDPNLLPELISLYESVTEPDYEKRLNLFIIDAYTEMLGTISLSDIKNYFEDNPFLKDKIKERYELSLLYRQPVVILLYYLISKETYKTKNMWPLTDNELRPLFTDLGKAFSNM